ncbi:MAG: penicillin-insensitive murein endopeptidase [Myxococcales bacterium]|nr:penicillin-insensitive murein endopeptidase [Myxococcales bacterium]
MLTLRITAPDGNVRMVPLDRAELTVGRTPDNTVVLTGSGVSSHHCAFLVGGNGQCVLQDRGSTNGTFVNNAPVQQSGPLGDHDKIYVGQYLLEVMHGASGISVHPPTEAHAAARPVGQGAGLLIQREDRGWRDQHKRILRAAEQWNEGGRPDRLTLRPAELRRARAWLAQTPPDRQGLVTPLQRELLAASGGANARRAAKRAVGIGGIVLALGGLVTAAVLLWPEGDDEEEVEASADDGGPQQPELEPDLQPQPPPEPPKPPDDRVQIKEQIDHVVIPEETLDDIAQRYGVSVAKIAEWNLLNPDDPGLSEGKIIKIKKPTKRPLPQQRIPYELEPEDTSWSKLSKRFNVPVKKLRAYNPAFDKLKPGQEVVIWIDPKPYAPKEPRQAIPQYVPDQTAQAIGSPNSGTLENGLQIPDSPNYKRRYPYIMWGSGYLVANVQKAVAQFRQDMDFDGTIVLADVSKKSGGFFSPHKSHQQGRDIDIWLPTVRGVFKEKYLTEDGDEKWGRRPNPEEVDWFATWGLVRALIDTGAVQDIFLDHTIQPKVYDAAKFLGVSEQELDEAIQWPRSKHSVEGILSHSDAHIHHMHVRFKCAPYEKQCRRYTARTE